MTLADIILCLAGIIGMTVAVIHAVVMQCVVVPPVQAAVSAGSAVRGATKRLLIPLLHVSSVTWFVEGAALVASALLVSGPGRMIICTVAAVSYGYAAALNAWATRGRHFGWVLMAAAFALIAIGGVASV